MATGIQRGNSMQTTVVFRNSSGTPVDVDTVIFSTRVGSATQSSITWTEAEPDARIEHVSTGTYRTIIYLGTHGSWTRSWQGILDGESTFKSKTFKVLKGTITPTTP